MALWPHKTEYIFILKKLPPEGLISISLNEVLNEIPSLGSQTGLAQSQKWGGAINNKSDSLDHHKNLRHNQ